MGEGRVCVVTGGRGFAARYLVLQLLRSEDWKEVRILDLADHISLDHKEKSSLLAASLLSGKATYVSVDVRHYSQVFEACKGADVVFHMASPDSSINDYNLHYSVTVQGTHNVVNACISHNVHKLIYTGSATSVFDGVNGIIDGDESMPYPDRHNDFYSETKAQAEAIVLSANGKSGLITCVLRPSGIFGPGDRLIVPYIVSAARSGIAKFILGDGKNVYDLVYVENVAHAHICAEKALDVHNSSGDAAAAGKAYFITNKEPIQLWEFISRILEGLGYERPKFHLPVKLLMPFAFLVAWVYEHMPNPEVKPPLFTPSRLRLLSSWHTYKCDRATQLLNYHPIVSLEEGIGCTIDSFSALCAQPKNSKSSDSTNVSKLHRFLGEGKDLHLWRNTKDSLLLVSRVFVIIIFGAVILGKLTCCFNGTPRG